MPLNKKEHFKKKTRDYINFETISMTDPRDGSKTPRLIVAKPKGVNEDGQKKLPRPIVFWSLNEKSAFRKNRVVQTRMNMTMDDITTQRQSSIRWIRYEAHKFRQRSGKYYKHPDSGGDISSKNIAPQAWLKKNIQKNAEKEVKDAQRYDKDSEKEYENTVNLNCESLENTTVGIITEVKRPMVDFSVNSDVHKSNGKKCKDLKEDCSKKTVYSDEYIRSLSAVPFNNNTDNQNNILIRQRSAAPAINHCLSTLSSPRVKGKKVDISLVNSSKSKALCNRLSDTFFDRTKAACELRIDLKRRATIRGQGITPSIFTLNDALRIEREKFTQSQEKIVSYMNRVEAIKRGERTILTKWTRGAFEQGLVI